MKFSSVIFSLILLVCSGPCFAEKGEIKEISSGVSYQRIGEYSTERLNAVMTSELSKFSDSPIRFQQAKYPVTLYKVTYNTVIPEKRNRAVVASGLVAVPQINEKSLPVVSYQHGTVFTKTAVPSSPDESMETRLMIACFAGQGYIVIGADYIGKGISTEPDSYLVKDSTAQACFDMLMASRAVCADLQLKPTQLFLSGWSQGAFSTMVFLNKLEHQGIPVTASATASTPNDLYMCLGKWINASSSTDVNWLVGTSVLILHSYENYYDLKGLCASAIKKEYQTAARSLYENTMTWDDAAKQLPGLSKDLVTEDFAVSSSAANSRFSGILQQNVDYMWRFKTPTRFYYGKIDEVVTPYVATLPVEYQRTIGGAESSAVYAGDAANHRGTFVFGIQDQLQWFQKLISSQSKGSTKP